MKRIFTIFLTFLLFYKCYSQCPACIDSTVYLYFGKTKVDCIKRYFKYEIDGKDTTVYKKPELWGYLYKDFKREKIKTILHNEYGITQNINTGGWSAEKFQTDSVYVDKFLGEINRDSLFVLLTGKIFLQDRRHKLVANNNYSIALATKETYVELNRATSNLDLILKYELSQLKSGDIVFFRDVSFNPISPNSPPFFWGEGYWKIK